MTRRCLSAAVTVVVALAAVLWCSPAGADPSGSVPRSLRPAPYASWPNGPGCRAVGQGAKTGADFFPIAVWLQHPRNAPKYKAIGINLYIGLWKGPTEDQLAALTKAQMPVVCSQNAIGLKHKDDPIIVAWMHGDEPDNAQSRGRGKGYGPPVAPAKIQADYERIRKADPTRPVILNLGQGVAWDGWVGRGVRTNHPEDYTEYVKGCDIASFDIYPAVSTRKATAGKLWLVPYGVERLRKWAGADRIVWNCIECTRIGNPRTKPTPHQVRAEVWMALIHGSRGLIYFVHQFKPRFIEAGLLADGEMTRAVGEINRQIHALAPVLNRPSVPGGVTVTGSNPDVPVAATVKRHGRATYVFAVAMRDGKTRATFKISGAAVPAGARVVKVLDENHTISLRDGAFEDTFTSYQVHLYRIQ